MYGSLGIVLAQPDGSRPRPVAFDLGAAASVWLWRGVDQAPADEFRLTAEALTRFSLHQAFPSEQNLLVGFLGQSASGYGGGVALGAQVLDRQVGFLAVVRLQVSWGKRYKNPWAERKAAEPKTTADRGRQIGEGFGRLAIQVDARVGTSVNALSGILADALKK